MQIEGEAECGGEFEIRFEAFDVFKFELQFGDGEPVFRSKCVHEDPSIEIQVKKPVIESNTMKCVAVVYDE